MIRHLLASAQDRRDEIPNQELAAAIHQGQYPNALPELISYLKDKDKKIQQDSIKVLYEIGELNGKTIAPYTHHFMALLQSKNNRMVWGAMMALHKISCTDPDLIYPQLPTILDAMEKGTVICKDNGLFVLIALAANENYAKQAQPLLLEQLQKAAINQFPMYVERSMDCWDNEHRALFTELLHTRFPELGKVSREKRIQKVLKKCAK